MKKMFRSLSLVLVIVTLCLSLASCTKMIFGSYAARVELLGQSVEETYTFGLLGRVTRTRRGTVLGTVTTTEDKGTYKIEKTADDKLEITLTFEEDGKTVESTYAFEQGKEYIKIGLAEYKKEYKKD